MTVNDSVMENAVARCHGVFSFETTTYCMYTVKATTTPTEPVSIEELSAFLRLNTSTESTLLGQLRTTARMLFEANTGYIVAPATFVESFTTTQSRYFLHRAPVASITHVKVFDDSGTLVTVTPAETDLLSPVASVRFDSSPVLSNRIVKGQITYVAGTTCPADVKTAIMLLSAHYYKTRSAFIDSAFVMREVPLGFQAICDKYRLYAKGVE
jgi:uncharacterized phiE125 gp8 family phage protein